MYGKAISLKEAQRFYADIKGRMSKYGRTPDQLKFLPGLSSVVGRTEKEAREKFRATQDLLTEDEMRHMISHVIPGIDFSNFELDEPVPSDPAIDKAAKKFRIFLELDGRRLTVREVADYVSTGIGHLKLIGSPGQIADTMVQWFDENGADGFNVMGNLEDFVEYVVPELQDRGVFRTEYEFETLRENLGLARPESVWATQPA
jgi:alkanesulfonate monooxygenase SsuD/methylene tetrahydromethanopterin reductase-like flavin-dependent oxidoreductase (luciferase family)